MLFVEPGEDAAPRPFQGGGFYATGMDEMDGVVVVTDIRKRAAAGVGTGRDFGLRVPDLLAGADTFVRLGRTLLYDDAEDSETLAVMSVQERYANMFDWLKAHDVNAAVVIVIMLVVAFFNMTSALLIVVLERTRMIGLLKAFGMRNGCLRRIFLWRALMLTLKGAGVGQCRRTGNLSRAEMDASGEAQLEGYLRRRCTLAGLGLVAGAQRGFVAAIVAPAGDPDSRGLHREGEKKRFR